MLWGLQRHYPVGSLLWQLEVLFTHLPVTTRDPCGERAQLSALGHVTRGCTHGLHGWELLHTRVLIGGHVLWGEAVVLCEGGQKAVSQTLRPQVRHAQMLGWSKSRRSGSGWGGRSSWAPPGFSNSGLRHQLVLYSWDKKQELGARVGVGQLLLDLVPAGHAHEQRCWTPWGGPGVFPSLPCSSQASCWPPAQGY